jgi:hypothetical protein
MLPRVIAVLVLASGAHAAPFVTTDPLPPEATHCAYKIDGQPAVDVPVEFSGPDKVCMIDLLNIGDASYALTLKTVVAGPPRQESPPSFLLNVREVHQTNRVVWRGWTNLICPATDEPCFWQ